MNGVLPFGLGAIRRDGRAFAGLAILLLAMQLFMSGLASGAMAAASTMPGAVICTGAGHTSTVPPDFGHRIDCRCLGATCSGQAALPDRAADTTAPWPSRQIDATSPGSPHLDGPDRRPLALFARAGHSPPIPS